MEAKFSDMEINIKTQLKQVEKQIEEAFNERARLFTTKQS